jgi:hypothetical protein
MNMVRFVMNNVNWRCVDRSGTETQKSYETHTSCNWRRVVSRGVDRKNQVETWSDRCPKNMLVSVLHLISSQGVKSRGPGQLVPRRGSRARTLEKCSTLSVSELDGISVERCIGLVSSGQRNGQRV